MKKLLARLLSEKLSTLAAITLTFTYTILLNRDFECTCKSKGSQCDMYMYLPFFIILFLILLTDGSFQTVCRYLFTCAGCRNETTCNFMCSFFLHILKAALVGLLWVAFVLLDGDWYVCCKNNHSEQPAPLACKAKDNITEEEQLPIAELKNTSRVYGGSILGGVVLVASLIPPCLLIRCCRKEKGCCNRGLLLEEVILEEDDNVLKEILRKSAKDPLTETAKPTTSKKQNPPQHENTKNVELQVKQKDNNQHEEQEDRM